MDYQCEQWMGCLLLPGRRPLRAKFGRICSTLPPIRDGIRMVDPALALGAAVVKATCKIWLKDLPLAADVSARVVDIIEAKVSGDREKRRIKRIFEDLEEKIADNVLNALKVEFSNMPPNDREATVLAVADTFNNARLTNKDLFSSDLDPLYLERCLRLATQNATDGLSQDSIELYGRILSDCCAYVVDISNTLPGFEVGAFAVVLSRQSEILRQIDELFDRVPMRPKGRGVEFFESAYRRLVAKQLDQVELFGVTVSEKVRSYALSTAYVSLKINLSSARNSLIDERSADMSDLKHDTIASGSHTMLIEEALGAARRIFLRGEAGSGKTTLLQWLAVRSSSGDFRDHLSSWNDSIPFFIRLRRYSGKDLPRPEEFLHGVGRHVSDQMPMGWIHEMLNSGRALVLIDGVDELPDVQRNSARSWLRELVQSYPDARYVITSRPAAAPELWLQTEDFNVLEIQSMSLADIEAFVSHWHSAFYQNVVEGTELDRIKSCEQQLLESIRSRRHLRMLATSPLLTALLCALHLDRRMQLPRDRMELYSVALEMLLERRDVEREINTSEVSMSRTDKTIILEDIAYWLIRNGWSDATVDRVLDRLTDKLSYMHRVNANAEQVLQFLLDRSGLLRTPVEGRIDFVHKTFQEFLAARAAIGSDDIGVLVQNANNDQWREVVLMAAGHAQVRQREELLTRILERAKRDGDNRHVLQALAVGCLQNSPELSLELSEKLQRVTSRLLPPKSLTEASALANAGDLALELLSARSGYTTREAVATIRMASIIGGDHAMSIIARCAHKPGSVVRNELHRAWLRFDAEVYARDILGKYSDTSYISIEDPNLIPGLKYLGLTALRCSFAHGYGNLDYLENLPLLNDLFVDDLSLTDISGIAGHPTLTSVEFRRAGMFDVHPLSECTRLKRLDLEFCKISNPSALRELHSLESLQFYDSVAPRVVVKHLEPTSILNRIGFWNAGQVEDISFLFDAPQLTKLKFLLLGRASELKTISGINNWSKTLTGVYLRAGNLTGIELLSELQLLDFANLSLTPLRSLEFLSPLVRLKRLHIGGCGRIPNLSPLSDLPSLRDLHLWGSDPVDLSGLADSRKLTVHIQSYGKRTVVGEKDLHPTVKITAGS